MFSGAWPHDDVIRRFISMVDTLETEGSVALAALHLAPILQQSKVTYLKNGKQMEHYSPISMNLQKMTIPYSGNL